MWRTLGALGLALALGSAACSEPETADAAAVTLSDDEVVERFVEIWAREVGIYSENRWLGVQALQNPLDAWVTQEIIAKVKPDVIVEAGTWKGGSAPYWAMVLEQVNPQGRVITIDIEDRVTKAKQLDIWKRKIDFLVGSSTDPAIIADVKRRAAGKRVLVILDSLHTRDHVLEELRLYAPLVALGSYVIVQDTGLWRTPQHGDGNWASDGVTAFIAETDGFVVDKSHQRFMVTNNPDGYLRRVR